MKICTLCNTTKHLSEFKLDKKRIDGVSSWCKNCHSKKTCEYQAKNRDKCNLNNKKYYSTEKGKAARKRYKLSITGKRAKLRYNKSNFGRAASARHSSTIRALNKAVINDLTMQQWSDILLLQNNLCTICNITFDNSNILTRAERDHIIPLSKGGALTKSNVQALCRSCNSIKGNKLPYDILGV